ncbi:MAG: hypothetical protein ACR2IE_18080 [Candidatus Sumerlaeaceae bacterium]
MADTKKKHAPDVTRVDDRYERSDARYSAIVLWIIVIGAAAVLSGWASYYYYRYATARLEDRRQPAMSDMGPRAPANKDMPLLQLNPTADMIEFDRIMDEASNSYGWVSKEAGVVRLPITRAMELTLQRGLPADEKKPETTATAPDTGADLPQDSSSGRTSWNVQR